MTDFLNFVLYHNGNNLKQEDILLLAKKYVESEDNAVHYNKFCHEIEMLQKNVNPKLLKM